MIMLVNYGADKNQPASRYAAEKHSVNKHVFKKINAAENQNV